MAVKFASYLTSSNPNFSDGEIPVGAVDGVNKAFILAHDPNPPSSLKLYQNGVRQQVSDDYTLHCKTLTYSQAPPVGTSHLADYRY